MIRRGLHMAIKLLSAVLAVSAFAAVGNLSMTSDGYAAPPTAAFSWSGCYVGVNAGGAWTNSDVSYTQTGGYTGSPAVDQSFAHNLGSPSLGEAAFAGGGQVGCNYQVNSVVLGVETDIDYLHASANYFASGTVPTKGSGVSSTVNVTTDWLASARGRLGYADGRWLFYGTGGLAVGNLSFSQRFLHLKTGSVEAGSASSTRVGWTAGAGVEYAVTQNLSAKFEYLYTDLGSVNFNSTNDQLPAFTASNSAKSYCAGRASWPQLPFLTVGTAWTTRTDRGVTCWDRSTPAHHPVCRFAIFRIARTAEGFFDPRWQSQARVFSCLKDRSPAPHIRNAMRIAEDGDNNDIHDQRPSSSPGGKCRFPPHSGAI